MLTIFARGSDAYDAALRKLERRGDADLAKVEPAVRAILEEVRTGGDRGLCACIERFEQRASAPLVWDRAAIVDGARVLAPNVRARLQEAAARIRRYHDRQKDGGFRYEEDGVSLGPAIPSMSTTPNTRRLAHAT